MFDLFDARDQLLLIFVRLFTNELQHLQFFLYQRFVVLNMRFRLSHFLLVLLYHSFFLLPIAFYLLLELLFDISKVAL